MTYSVEAVMLNRDSEGVDMSNNVSFNEQEQQTNPQHTVTNAAMLPLLYSAEEGVGWTDGMQLVTLALLVSVTLPDGPVLEVGCGGGQMLVELEQKYADRLVCGADLHSLALAHARSLLAQNDLPIALVQAALPKLPWQENCFALLLAMDVFDQQGVDLPAVLAEAYRLLRPGGALVMRVSAHPSLYGAHDIAFHTGRRYTRAELNTALTHAGFTVQRLTYANAILAAPVAAQRLAQRWGIIPFQPGVYRQDLLQQVAVWALRQEAEWLHHADLALGLSLCAVARKPRA